MLADNLIEVKFGMRTRIIIYLCAAVLTLSFVGCGRTDNAADGVNALHEEPQAAAIDNKIPLTDSTEPILFPIYRDMENAEIEEIQNQCQEIALLFNDLFEALYRERYKDHVYTDNYEYDPDMQCSIIPAEIFENTILPYFEIPLDEFRASTLYMRESNAYPWQALNGSNIIYCPALTPEVVERRDNEDGTFTIVVDVLCFDYKCFPMFTHEITIRPNGDGGFHYVANRVTYVSEQGVPATTPRLKAQRK